MHHLSRYKGTPYEVGLAIGQEFGRHYLNTLDDLLLAMGPVSDARRARLFLAAQNWFARLPLKYQDEFSGIAFALNCQVEELLLTYVADDHPDACTSFIAVADGLPWIGRNNDFIPSCRWNHAGVREIPGRLGTMLFGLPGDPFSGTGINEKRLWLHYNWLPPMERSGSGMAMEPYVFLREALETCSSISELDALLSGAARNGGMALFAVDGRSGEYALFECSCTRHAKVNGFKDFIVAANHYDHLPECHSGGRFGSSHGRKERVEHLLASSPRPGRPGDYMAILADGEVEQHGTDSATVYSLVASPCTGEIWFSGNAIPSASCGNWEKIDFAW